MSNIPSDAWWADYENDESILADRYRSLGLELDDPLDLFTTLPTWVQMALFYRICGNQQCIAGLRLRQKAE